MTTTVKQKTIGIIGLGRFGRLLEEVLAANLLDWQIKVHSRSHAQDGEKFFSLQEAAGCDFVIPAVPIRAFAECIQEIAPLLKAGGTVIDVCSIKLYPKQVMLENLPKNVNIIATHPMFGPATYKKLNNSLQGLTIVVEKLQGDEEIYTQLKQFLQKLKLNVVEMSADEHDRLAAKFHFITNVVGSLLKEINLKRSRIDTKSASVMMDFVEMLSTDQELVKEMYDFNPYCQEEFGRLDKHFQSLKSYLLTKSK